MADSKARIILSAEDRTKAAFASATRSLDTFNLRATSVTGALARVASFGAAGGTLLAFGAAAGVSAGAMVAAAKAGIDLADSLFDISKRTSVSVETLSGLRIVADQSGTSLETLARGIKELNIGLSEAGRGEGENVTIFKQLGLAGLSTEEALLRVSDAFVALEKDEDRATLAQKLFKRSGQELLPLLLEGSAKLRLMSEEGRRVAGVTTAMAKQADEFNDQMTLLKGSLTGVGLSLADLVLPKLNSLIKQMRDGTRIAGGFFSALALLGTSKPISIENLQAYEKELSRLQELQSQPPNQFRGGIVEQEKKRIEELKKLIEFQRAALEDELSPLKDAFGPEEKKPKGPSLDLSDPDKNGRTGGKKRTLADELKEEVANAQREAAKLKFLQDNFAEFGASITTSKEALARFDTTAGEFKGIPGIEKLGEAARKAGKDIDEGTKKFDLTLAIDKLNQEAAQLAYQAVIFEELGEAAAGSAESLADFNATVGEFKGVEGADKLKAAGAAVDQFKRKLDIQQEIARFNEGIDDALADLKDLQDFGEVNPFGRGEREAQRLIRGPLAKEPEEKKIALEFKGKESDFTERARAVEEFASAQNKVNDAINFETSLIGRTRQEQRQLTAAREVDIEIQRLSVGATEEERRAIEARGEAIKDNLRGAIAVQEDIARSFSTGWNEAFNEYIDRATDASSQARDLFEAAADGISGGLFDALQGDFDNIGASFKRTIDRMVSDWLTAQALIQVREAFPDLGEFLGGTGSTAKAASTAADTAATSASNTALAALATSATTANTGLLSLNAGTTGASTGLTSMIAPLAAAQTAAGSFAAAVTAAIAQIQASALASSAGSISAKGNVFSGGNLMAFASGGVVGQPTFFPMADGGTGLMGEAGPEAIMPLKRGKTGKLGVHFINEDGEDDTLPLARDSRGRLSVRAFAKGGIFDDAFDNIKITPFALGGVLNSTDMPSNMQRPAAQTASGGNGTIAINMSIQSPDVGSFRRSQTQIMNELTNAMAGARRRI